MALTKEQEAALQAHLQDSSMMGKIKSYALKHKGWGTGDIDQVDQANNVDQVAADAAGAPTAQPQHMDEGGFVDTLKQGANAALSTLGLPQMMKAVMPQPAPVDPMAKPFAQEDEQSASYKPPFGNEATAGPAVTPPTPVAKTPKPSSLADSGTPDKVADSHPGFNQDELEKYLLNEKGQMDKYGADSMAKKYQDLHDEQNSLGSTIARKMHGAADDIMMGVARAGNPGHEHAFDEKQAQQRAQLEQEAKSLNEANMASVKAKQALDQQSSANPLGASAAAAMMPILKQIYPGKTDAEYATMAHNPAVAEALLPEGVKLKDAQARLAQTKGDKEFQHEMARENMQYRKDHDYMTREQKDSSGMLKDPNVVKAQGTLDKLHTAKELLESGNVNNATAKQALQTALTFVATGGQRVNETEMKQLGGAHTVTNRINQWMQGLDRGTLTPKDYQDMKGVIGIYENSANRSLDDAATRFGTIRATREGISSEQAMKDLGRTPNPAGNGQVQTVSSQEEYNALPSGASYMANGILHRKK